MDPDTYSSDDIILITDEIDRRYAQAKRNVADLGHGGLKDVIATHNNRSRLLRSLRWFVSAFIEPIDLEILTYQAAKRRVEEIHSDIRD